MSHTLSIMEARKQLTSLPETLVHNGQLDVLEITRRGKPVLAVLPWELYEAVSETLEVMGDKELMACVLSIVMPGTYTTSSPRRSNTRLFHSVSCRVYLDSYDSKPQ